MGPYSEGGYNNLFNFKDSEVGAHTRGPWLYFGLQRAEM